MADTKNVYQRLLEVQSKAVAPRQASRFNSGSRSAEQILEAIKKPCHAEGLLLFTTEEVELVGDRTRIKATATVVNIENPEERISASASAWEGEISAGLDASQVSGKTGSYAKKYALQNLFSIDDTKDADFEHDNTSPQASTTGGVANDAREAKEDRLARAKADINEELERQGYEAAVAKKAFITRVLSQSKIETIEQAHEVMDALENEKEG